MLTDTRLSPIKLGNLTITFRHAAPSRLYWAGHPAMRIVQALYWLRDMLATNKHQTFKSLVTILCDPDHGQAIRDDLHNGLPTLPEWLQAIVRDLLRQANGSDQSQNPDNLRVQDKTRSKHAKHQQQRVSTKPRESHD